MVLNPVCVLLFLTMDKFFPRPRHCLPHAWPARTFCRPLLGNRPMVGERTPSRHIYMNDALRASRTPPITEPAPDCRADAPALPLSVVKNEAPLPLLGHFITTKLVDNRHSRRAPSTLAKPYPHAQPVFSGAEKSIINHPEKQHIRNNTASPPSTRHLLQQPPAPHAWAHRLPAHCRHCSPLQHRYGRQLPGLAHSPSPLCRMGRGLTESKSAG